MIKFACDQTLVELLHSRVEQTGDQTALFIKRSGIFQAITWREIYNDILRTSVGLRSLGVKSGDRVAQYSENCYQWIISDFAIQVAGGVHVPIHAPLTGQQVAQQIQDSGSKVVLVGDKNLAKRLASCGEHLPSEVQYLSYESGKQTINGQRVRPLSEITHDVLLETGQRLIEHTLESLSPDSYATILYTSGTTGTPKGVVLSHRNLVSNTLGTVDAFGIQPSDLRVNFLPLSHIFARTCDLYTWVARGSELALAESRETILPDCVRLGPTMMNGVPYFYLRVHRYLVEQGRDQEEGSLRKLFGGKIRLCCVGGAALPDYLYDFFAQHDIPLLQGYGLSESSPVISLNSPGCEKRGSVGKPIPGVEVKIADDGEIMARGPNIMVGYWQNQQATDQIIHRGWLHTGDLGQIDDEGFLSITGRKKEILVTAGGKNVAPIYLENLLVEDPLIAQALVIGDGRNCLSALIVPDPDYIKKLVRRLRILPLSKQWVVSHPRIRAEYARAIQERLQSVSHHEQVRRFTVMDRGFTMETDEMTPKLSLKRKLIEKNCAEIIEAMYQPAKTRKSWTDAVLSRVRGIWMW